MTPREPGYVHVRLGDELPPGFVEVHRDAPAPWCWEGRIVGMDVRAEDEVLLVPRDCKVPGFVEVARHELYALNHLVILARVEEAHVWAARLWLARNVRRALRAIGRAILRAGAALAEIPLNRDYCSLREAWLDAGRRAS